MESEGDESEGFTFSAPANRSHLESLYLCSKMRESLATCRNHAAIAHNAKTIKGVLNDQLTINGPKTAQIQCVLSKIGSVLEFFDGHPLKQSY